MAQKNKTMWTKEQQKVIDLRNRNILVSAAAGSGKTAVLVERIITMITDKEHPVDIDKLLVVTFTNAAAAEMRERIHNAIEKKIDEEPDNLHLRKQGTLVRNAQITTFHSFCQNLIRNHFNEIDVDPAFRIGDEVELKLLQSDVLDQIFEEHYERDEETGEYKDPAFLELVECYSSGKSDEGLRELLLQLYTFAMSYPWPEKWLLKQKDNFSLSSLEEMEETEWMQLLKEYVNRMVEEALVKNTEALNIVRSPSGPYMYEDALISDREYLERLESADSYEEKFLAICGMEWKRLSTKKDVDIDLDKREDAKKLRNESKDIIKKLQPQFFFQEPAMMLEDMQKLEVPMSKLVDLTLELKHAYDAAKEEKKVVDFNDLEHFALKILVREEDGELKSTEVARMYSEEFTEILVDEYQDSNAVQETLLNSISKEAFGLGQNRFMVGDVKQSIYKFRLARPEIFMEKYENYSLEDSDYQRVDLSKNFRSRGIVLESVNAIFEKIMKKDLGKVEYDASAKLYVGNTSFPEEARGMDKTELLLFDAEGEEVNEEEDTATEEKRFSKRELEAKMVAKRIKELVDKENGLQVVDKKTGELRGCEYGDIVILLRTMSGWSDVFLEELKNQGIPVYTETRTGYFSTFEIRTMLQFLKVIDNPRQDIPLAAVLRSPIGNFTAEDLAKMRKVYQEGDLYDTLEAYSECAEDYEKKNIDFDLSRHAVSFLEMLSYFRKMVSYTPIHKLLEEIYEKTGYYEFVSVMPGGSQRRDNLDLLLQKAIDMEATSLSTLFHFNRYIEKLHKYEVDFGEAVGADANEHAVQIMSIHKSKGLEFPVVFVSGMEKQFNNQDARSKIVLDLDLGIGPDVVDYEKRTKMPSLIKKTIQKVNVLENMGEELRVLYVALTRAKEKLIMTGYVEKSDDAIESWHEDYVSDMSYVVRSSARNYLDWVAPVAMEGVTHFEVRWFSWKDIIQSEVVKQVQAMLKKEELKQWNVEQVYDEKLKDKLEERLNFSYPYENERTVKSKLTVSELKRMIYLEEENMGQLEFQNELVQQEEKQKLQSELAQAEEKQELQIEPIQVEEKQGSKIGQAEEKNKKSQNEQGQSLEKTEGEQEQKVLQIADQIPLPEFLKDTEETFTAADRGTIYHKVLELLPIKQVKTNADAKRILNHYVEQGILTEQEIKLVVPGRIVKFAKSNLASRMAAAKEKSRLWCEQPFVIGLPAREVKKEWDSEEMILVQGMVDAYFEEEDGLVLLDYKTDWVKTEEELIKRYHSQLEYYQKALEQITGKKVKEKVIYSLVLGKEILL